jgi:hypothetical protein
MISIFMKKYFQDMLAGLKNSRTFASAFRKRGVKNRERSLKDFPYNVVQAKKLGRKTQVN